jgi:hypothetical protein
MKTILFDASVLAGVGSIAYAGWLLHPALAWLVAGVALAVFGVLGAAGRQKETDT